MKGELVVAALSLHQHSAAGRPGQCSTAPQALCSSAVQFGKEARRPKVCRRLLPQVYVADGPPVEFELDGVVWKSKQG